MNDKFQADPGNGRSLTIKSVGPQVASQAIGKPQQGGHPSVRAQAPQPIVQQPVGMGNNFSGGGPGNMPKGAQQVQLMGTQSPVVSPSLGSAAPQVQLPRMPAAPQAQAPALHGGEGESYRVSYVRRGLDGEDYIAEFDANFPSGTKEMGAPTIKRVK